MNEVKDGMCIIDAVNGIDCATPEVGQFTDSFDKVKFLLGKDFSDYTMVIITDINGHVEVISTDDDNLTKETVDGETYLLWSIGLNVTALSGVIIYQIAAYKRDGDAIKETWYSKEGRLIVTESINTNEYSANILGSQPNLLERLLTEIDDVKNNVVDIRQSKVDVKEGFGLSENNFSGEEKKKLSLIEDGAEVNVTPDWEENDENSDSFIKNKPLLSTVALSGRYDDLTGKPSVDISYDGESQNAQSGIAVKEAIAKLVSSAPDTLDTLYELSKALGDDPNFSKTILENLSKKVDKVEGKGLSSNDYTNSEKEKLSTIERGAEKNVMSDWEEKDANSDRFIKNKPHLSKVATSGSYSDLSEKPYIPSISGLASETYVDYAVKDLVSKEYVSASLKEKCDKSTCINGKSLSDDVNLTADDVGAVSKEKIIEGFGIPFDESATDLVTINKVHPKEHDVVVNLESKNLISPSVFADYELQEDGSYYAPSENSKDRKKYAFYLPAGTYTLSYQLKASAPSGYRICLKDKNGKTYSQYKVHTEEFISYVYTFTASADIETIQMDWGTASEMGCYFKDLQIEKGTVATPYISYISDMSVVDKVTTFGKNLVNVEAITQRTEAGNGYAGFVRNGDGSYTMTKGVGNDDRRTNVIQFGCVIPKGTEVTLSVRILERPNVDDGDMTFFLSGQEIRTWVGQIDTNGVFKKTVTLNRDVSEWYISMVYGLEAGMSFTFDNLQLEFGNAMTENEAFKSATYPVTDGKAIVKSVSPTMNITTLVNGVSVNAKGYQDGLAVIDELKQAIISLGGNV